VKREATVMMHLRPVPPLVWYPIPIRTTQTESGAYPRRHLYLLQNGHSGRVSCVLLKALHSLSV